jgi:GDPmannose 4,6-dehydratase
MSPITFLTANHQPTHFRKARTSAPIVYEMSEGEQKLALITGISGQDGYYLTNHLLSLGYTVVGTTRRINNNFSEKVHIEELDLNDPIAVEKILNKWKPTEIYHLASQSSVALSFKDPNKTCSSIFNAVINLLEGVRKISPNTKIFHAGSSEMFGDQKDTPQTTKSQFHPRSPYGCAKVFAHHLVATYRETYNLYAVTGILYNHESPRRGLEFVPRKVTNAVAAIVFGELDHVELGNLNSEKDWGWAPDFVKAMHLMLQQKEPQDQVLGTGKKHSVRDLCEYAFKTVGLDYNDFVRINPNFFRPAEVCMLVADTEIANSALGWKSEVGFEEMVRTMVISDIRTRLDHGKTAQISNKTLDTVLA